MSTLAKRNQKLLRMSAAFVAFIYAYFGFVAALHHTDGFVPVGQSLAFSALEQPVERGRGDAHLVLELLGSNPGGCGSEDRRPGGGEDARDGMYRSRLSGTGESAKQGHLADGEALVPQPFNGLGFHVRHADDFKLAIVLAYFPASTKLGEHGFFTWDGNYYALNLTERLDVEKTGGFLRIGLVHYNTADEVDRFLAALREIVGA